MILGYHETIAAAEAVSPIPELFSFGRGVTDGPFAILTDWKYDIFVRIMKSFKGDDPFEGFVGVKPCNVPKWRTML